MMLGISGVIAFLLLAQGEVRKPTVREQGMAAFNEGRYSVALTKLSEAVKDAGDREAQVFLALTKAALGDCQEALPGLNDASSTEFGRLAGLAALRCYSSAGDAAQTFSLLAQLERRFPNDADVLYLKAKLHMKAFNDATFEMFQHAAASYRVHELSAEIFEVQSRYGEAVAEYRKAIDINPRAPDLHFKLGRALLLQSHSAASLEEAAREFKAELGLNPEDGACEFQLAQIAQVEGKAAEAKAHFERAVSLSPNFAQALIGLGKIHAQEKQYEQAVALLKRASELQPANETAHYALQTVYRDSGQMDKAKAEKAILDKLQTPPEGEFSEFLKKLGEKPSAQ